MSLCLKAIKPNFINGIKLKSQINNSILINSYSSYKAVNEPIYDYKKGSAERENLNKVLLSYLNVKGNDKRDALFDVPIVIGDKEIRNSNVKYQLIPFDHSIKLAKFYHADKALINEAIKNSMEARAAWEATSFDFRANILLKAADTLANMKRGDILAATMLGQGKTVYQAGKLMASF